MSYLQEKGEQHETENTAFVYIIYTIIKTDSFCNVDASSHNTFHVFLEA